MKKIYYKIQQLLSLLVLLRVIVDSFADFSTDAPASFNILDRFDYYAGGIVMILMLYLVTAFETGIIVSEKTENLSKFKRILLHIKYGCLIPFLIAINLIAYNIFTDTVLIPILLGITLVEITLLMFLQPLLFRNRQLN